MVKEYWTDRVEEDIVAGDGSLGDDYQNYRTNRETGGGCLAACLEGSPLQTGSEECEMAEETLFFWDGMKCRTFLSSGCPASSNHFESSEDCQAKCSGCKR